jgi:hypothetical protein
MPHAVAIVWRNGDGYGVDESGKETRLLHASTAASLDANFPEGNGELSPDGTHLAIAGSAFGPTANPATQGLWVLDLATGRASVYRVNGEQVMTVAWSRDGRSVLSERYGGGSSYVIHVPSGAVRQIPGFTGDVAGWDPASNHVIGSDWRGTGGQPTPSVGPTPGQHHVWLRIDPITGGEEPIPGLDGWSGVGDSGGVIDPGANPTPGTAASSAATLTGWLSGGRTSPDGHLVPFARPNAGGNLEVTVVDRGNGHRVRTWQVSSADQLDSAIGWLDADTMLWRQGGTEVVFRTLTVSTGGQAIWRTYPGADAVLLAANFNR